MDGSGIDFVVIPIVVLPIIAFWLYGMYYADSHSRWLSGPSGQRGITAAAVPAVPAAPSAQVVIPPQVPAVVLPSVAVENSAAPERLCPCGPQSRNGYGRVAHTVDRFARVGHKVSSVLAVGPGDQRRFWP